MDTRLIFAIITITLALIFYSIGVWSERKSATLKRWHVLAFWGGLVFDTSGTIIMTAIAQGGPQSASLLVQSIHAASGTLAIGLMIIHAIWSTIVLIGNDAQKKQTFHKFSIVVWSIWLIPYLAGMVMGNL